MRQAIATVPDDLGFRWRIFRIDRFDQREQLLAHHTDVAMPQLLRLSNDESILNQLLLRWELVARREYGCLPTPPPHAFELQVRKVKLQAKGKLGAEEARLEFHQAREDLMDGRLTRRLGRSEGLELAAVLSLWEMHDRGPRETKTGKAAAIHSLLREKKKNPTLDFDILPEEM